MVMNLNGVLTNMPLYDSSGNILPQMSPASTLPEVDLEAECATDILTEVYSVLEGQEALEVDPEVSIFDCENEDYSCYYQITVYGGDNGRGLWSIYFSNLSNFVKQLESKFEDVWISEMNIDTADDVFSVSIMIKSAAA